MSNALPQLVADRYRLVKPLGQGGMGRVWKARDEVLHRDVAIKELVPPPGLTDDERREMRERSLREARAIARLNHANVVRIFDVLRTDGDPWIVMEYVASRSLQDALAADGPVPPARAAEIGLGVLGALRAAHRSGVMHRDVKPGNVLLGEDGRVVLTDFGLATVPGDPNVTRTGLVLGSPAYISPERARDGTAGPEADLWSLGATLYAAVEGQSPYARPSAIGTLAALATEPPPPPKNAGPLKAVLNGLLQKDPSQRITAEVAERLLRRALDRRSRGGMSLLDGVRRPSPNGPREPRTRIVPQPRPPRDQPGSATPPAVPPIVPSPAGPAATPGPADPTEVATRVDVGRPAATASTPVPVDAADPTTMLPGGSSTASADPTAKVPAPDANDAGEPTAMGSRSGPAELADPTAKVATGGSTATTGSKSTDAAEPATKVQEPVSPTAATVAGTPKPAGTPAGARAGAAGSARVLGPPATVAGDGKGLLDRLPGNRRNWLIGALAVLVLLALIVIVPLANDGSDHPRSQPTPAEPSQPAAQPSTTPGTSASAAPAPTTAPPTTPPTTGGPGGFVLPAGWKIWKDPSGFSVPYPAGWKVSGKAPNNVYFRGGDGRWFLIGQTDHPQKDAVADWRRQESNRRHEFDNYQQVGIRHVTYWQEAADWEWIYTEDGTRVRTINRGFVTDPKHGYAIRWETPLSVWDDNLKNFQIIAAGFRPAGS